MIKSIDTPPLADVQANPDGRRVPISRVGVKNIRFPIAVKDRRKDAQHTVGTIDMSVDLPHHFKGTHMSRFMEILNSHDGEISVEALPVMLRTMRERLSAETAHLRIAFPYFLPKEAPVSGAEGLLSYDCAFDASSGTEDDFVLTVNVPVTTLCPCSREISARGAHNQRSMVTVQARFTEELWIEEVVALVDESASCGLYPVLKRSDEKWVTEQAYDNPRFVEDLVREVTLRLRSMPQVTWFNVHVVNFESIHEHDAYAQVEEPGPGRPAASRQSRARP
ncbi:MAG: GTP cyclohydrolase FolE2 [Gemmatimonadetes bacterium]|nr:GTP cyclohydrolase FolE2 [Gemmatimonadota bacterium]